MRGDSLEAALRDYGPAAIEDLLPRLRAIADTLDRAHAAGQVHGSLHPQHIFVSANSTHVIGLETDAAVESAVLPPYAAPETADGGRPVPASDRFALAAIAFEWLFGRRISGPAARPVEVRTLPGVDRDAMAAAFTRALAPVATDRFPSCLAFCDALSASVIPMLPLGTTDEDEGLDIALQVNADLEPVPAALPPPASVDAERIVEPVIAWQPSAAYSPPKLPERFGGGMLIAALLVGMVVGFAAGYMAKPRALQSGPLAGAGRAGEAGQAGEAGRAGKVETEAVIPPPIPAPAPPPAPPAQVSASIGRLLIRSMPSGASVHLDGVARGVTPLALRDLALGSRTIAVARSGYITDERRLVLTRARPSRSLEVRLSAAASSTGSLIVESRPAGAAVTIDGRARGLTPVTIEALAPGDYRVSLSLAGYQSFATTVRVVAGERTRAAASLSVQE